MSPIVDTTNIRWNASRADHPARIAAWRAIDAIARRDKDRYVSGYAPGGVIHDPVGRSSFDPSGSGHRGHEALAKFWDKSIAPIRSFRFTVHTSLATDDQVANSFTMNLEFSEGNTTATDCLCIYRVNDVGLLLSVCAYWETPA